MSAPLTSEARQILERMNTAGSVAAGASVTIGTNGGPYTIPNGTHTIAAHVDDVNRFAESDETNNLLSQSITIP